MREDIKQIAIKHLQEAKGFILICDLGERTSVNSDGLSLYQSLELIEQYKHKILTDDKVLEAIAKAKGERWAKLKQAISQMLI